MTFEECLNSFCEDFESFFKDYKFLDKDTTFTSDAINNISKIIEDFTTTSYQELTILNRRKTKLNDNFKATLKEHYKIERKNKKELKEKLKNLRDDADTKIANLKQELTETKEEYARNEYNSLNDIDFYIEGSNQNIDMFEIECRDNLNRYAYQIDVAKQSYNTNIDTFNAQLELQLQKITDEYLENIAACDKSYNELVESYNLVIEEKNKLIEDKKQEYLVAQVELKNKKRQESTDLNILIRKYSEEKSNKISEYRNEYLESQRLDNEQKSNLITGYKDETYKVNKDFVQNINDLDARIRDLRDKFEKYCDEENQTKYYTIFDIHIEQEKIIRTFINENKNNTKIKGELRKINKEFYKKVIEENKKCEKLLSAAKKEYSRNNNESLYEKKLLDISRNTFYAKMNEKQIRDNKLYQEKNIGYERLFNYNSLLATTEYNRNANKVLLDSSIRNLDIEKEIDETDAKYQIQIETLLDVIKKYQLEINIAKRLNELNHIYLDEKYARDISFHTVSNLLKIEKCKVLNEYNNRQFMLNNTNSENVLEYSKKKINLQNNKYSALKKQDIEIARSVLDNITSKNNYTSIVVNSKCVFDQDIANKEAKHTSSLNKSELLKEKFIVEVDEYENILQAYVIIYNSAVKAWNDIIDILLPNNESKDKLAIRFLNDLLGLFKSVVSNISLTYKTMISDEVKGHLTFDNDFKYKDILDALREQKDTELGIINHKKEITNYQLDLLRTKNDDIRLKLFTMQYDSGAKYDKPTRKKLVKDLLDELKQNNKQVDIIEKKQDDINKEYKVVDKKYNKSIDALLYEQDINSQPYKAFSEEVTNIIDKIKKSIFEEPIVEELSEREKYKVMLCNLSPANLTSLFTNNSSFSQKYQINYKLSIDKINSEYEENIKDTTDAYNDNEEKEKRKFINNNNLELDRIKSLNNDKAKLEKQYRDIIKNNDNLHQKEINEILDDKNNSTNNFYIELYAVDDNLNEVEKDYYLTSKEKEQAYMNSKQEIVDETLATKQEYNQALSNYISSRKDLINHLPIAIKENHKELLADYKEKNKELDLKLIQSKKELNLQKYNEKKNLQTIELNYKSSILKIDINDKKQKNKEKKVLNDLVNAN